MTPGELPAWFDTFLVNVCEIPDRNSPESEPQAIVATLEELRNCALNAMDAPATSTPAVKYFVYSNEGGLNEYATDKERAAAHQEEIESHMDMHGEGWSDEVTTVISGIVTHETVKASSTPNPGHAGDCECEPCREYADAGGTSEFSEICTYEAAPVAATNTDLAGPIGPSAVGTANAASKLLEPFGYRMIARSNGFFIESTTGGEKPTLPALPADGDSEETRKAFRDYDAHEPVALKTTWQVWRDAIAWTVARLTQ